MALKPSLLYHLLIASTLYFGNCPIAAQSRSSQDEVWALLQQPAGQLDFGKIKLAVDRIVDPSIDGRATLEKIDRMVTEIGTKLPVAATSMQKLQAIRAYLYGKGPWNNHQPFHYDFDDPKGTNLRSKTLARYLSTRKGNCVSMPLLMLVIADRMGLDLAASTAPEHILLKFTETETGRTYNVEATSGGGFARDSWYQEQFQATDQAMRKGLYLQKLSRKETAAVIMSLLGEYYFDQGDFEEAIKSFELVLKHYPKSVYSMLKLGGSYAKLFKLKFMNTYKTMDDVPLAERALLHSYVARNRQYFAMAESLGWREPKSIEQDAYSRRVNEARKKSSQYGK